MPELLKKELWYRVRIVLTLGRIFQDKRRTITPEKWNTFPRGIFVSKHARVFLREAVKKFSNGRAIYGGRGKGRAIKEKITL